MTRGRKPVTTEERIKRGETPKRPPLVVGGRRAPRMPNGLNDRAKTAWRQVVDDLLSSGVIDRADSTVIEILATAVGRYRDARTVLNREGILAENSQGRVAHPAVGIAERAEQRILQIADRLPLSPWGRTRLNLLLSSGGDEGAEADMEATIGRPPRLKVVGGGDD